MSRGWTQQPQVPVGIDWSNPITAGLELARCYGKYDSVKGLLLTGTSTTSVAKYNAELFNGSSDGLSVPYTKSLSKGITLFSLCYPTNSTATNTILGIGTGINDRYVLLDISGTQSNDPVRAISKGSVFGGATKTSLITFGSWQSVCGVFDSSAINNKIYINGVNSLAGTSAGDLPTPTHIDIGQSTQASIINRFYGRKAVDIVFSRKLSASEIKSLSDNPWQIFQPLTSRIFVGIPASGSPTLYPSLYTNTSELYSPTVTGTSSTQSVTANLLDNSGTAGAVYSPTVTRGAVSISPSLLDAGNSVYSPTVNTGSVLVSPAYFENPNSVYASTASAGTINVSFSIYENISVVESPLVLTDGNNIYANLLDNSFNNSVYQPSAVVGSVVINPAYFENAEEIYSSLVSSGRILSPAYFENPNSVYNCNVDPGSFSIYPGLYTNLSSIYSPTIGGAADLQSIVSTFLDNTGSGIGSISGTPEEVAAILLAAIRADPQILTVHKFLALSK